MTSDDKPILDSKEDRLGRSDFAKRLAKLLLTYQNKESIVVALYGPWGSGKTSLLNLTVQELENLGKLDEFDEPIILKFNPWYFSDQEHLISIFLGQLRAQFESKSDDVAKTIKENLQKYGGFIATPSFQTALSFIPVIGPYAEKLSKLLGDIWPLIAENASGGKENLEKLREDVDKAFSQLKQRVIIIMDDLDRLTQNEIRQLFQLVKLSASFPNTTYVIAADRKVLEKSLDTEQGISGRDYLEKIVQAGFDIPPISDLTMRDILSDAIEASLGDTTSELSDDYRWTDLFHSGFKQLFTTLRAVKRYTNSLSFNYQMVAAEVNPVDFIGIEAIRVFEPDLYRKIANNKMLFCGGNPNVEGTDFVSRLMQRQLSPEDRRKLFDDIFTKDKPYIIKLCSVLFPDVRTAYPNLGARNYGERNSNYRQQRRICSVDVFDTYFLLGTPPDDISREELVAFKNILESRSIGIIDKAKEYFNRHIESGLSQRFLELFEDLQEELSESASETFATVLVQIADSIPNDSGKWPMSAEWLISSNLWSALKKLNPQSSKKWIESRLQERQGLYHVVSMVSWQREDGQGPIKDIAIFDEPTTSELEQICVEVIHDLAKQGKLLQETNATYLLSRWSIWSKDKKEVIEYLETETKSPDKALEFLSLYTSHDRFINLGNIEQMLTLKQIDDQLQKISEVDALSERHRNVYEAWVRTLRPKLTSATN